MNVQSADFRIPSSLVLHMTIGVLVTLTVICHTDLDVPACCLTMLRTSIILIINNVVV